MNLIHRCRERLSFRSHDSRTATSVTRTTPSHGSEPDGGQQEGEEGPTRWSLGDTVQHFLHIHPTAGAFLVLVLAVVVFDTLNHRFLSAGNVSIMFQQVAVVGTLALGQTIIILTSGIDLSIGYAMILAQVVMVWLAFSSGLPAALALFVGIAAGAATGLVNGILVTNVRLPPFIVTLGTLSIFDALGLLYSNGQTLNVPASSLIAWTGTAISIGPLTITTGVLLMLALYLVGGYLLRWTAWGRHVYATGDDESAARLSGIRTRRVLLSVYVAAGVVVGIAGWIQVGRIFVGTTILSDSLNLDTITAVVIGGTSLFGGRGRLLGTLFGALIVEVFLNGLTLAGVQELYELIAEGALVLCAVAIDTWIRRVHK